MDKKTLLKEIKAHKKNADRFAELAGGELTFADRILDDYAKLCDEVHKTDIFSKAVCS